jgi:hypothetical protein
VAWRSARARKRTDGRPTASASRCTTARTTWSTGGILPRGTRGGESHSVAPYDEIGGVERPGGSRPGPRSSGLETTTFVTKGSGPVHARGVVLAHALDRVGAAEPRSVTTGVRGERRRARLGVVGLG